jgi:hypothetical protein
MNRIKKDKRGFEIGYYCNCSDKNLTEYLPVKAKNGRCIWCKYHARYGTYHHETEAERIERNMVHEDKEVHLNEYKISNWVTII